MPQTTAEMRLDEGKPYHFQLRLAQSLGCQSVGCDEIFLAAGPV